VIKLKFSLQDQLDPRFLEKFPCRLQGYKRIKINKIKTVQMTSKRKAILDWELTLNELERIAFFMKDMTTKDKGI